MFVLRESLLECFLCQSSVVLRSIQNLMPKTNATAAIKTSALLTTTGLEITPVRSSGTSRFSARASNFVFLLAPRARAQASRSPTKFLIMILRRKDKF